MSLKRQLIKSIEWKLKEGFISQEFDYPLQAFIDEEVFDSWVVVIDRDLDYETKRYNIKDIAIIEFYPPKNEEIKLEPLEEGDFQDE